MTEKKITVETEKGQMTVEVVDVTPEMAKELLELNTDNRNMRSGRVKMYAEDMISGNWNSNGVTIVIGNDGKLKDGQHRLEAIVKSNITIKNQIVVYLPKEQANCYDIGLSRTAADVAKFYGVGDDVLFRSTSVFAAMNVACNIATGKKNTSKIALVQKVKKYRDACEFVYKNLVCTDNCSFRRAGIAGAVINAYLSNYPLDKLARFCDVLKSGETTSKEEITIIKLRDYVMQTKSAKGGGSMQSDLYYRTQSALKAFEIGKILTRCVPSTKEYYSFPNDC